MNHTNKIEARESGSNVQLAGKSRELELDRLHALYWDADRLVEDLKRVGQDTSEAGFIKKTTWNQIARLDSFAKARSLTV